MEIDVILKPIQAEEIPLVLQWMEKEDILKFFGDPIVWLQEINDNLNNSDWIWYYMAYTDKPVGFCQFFDTAKAPAGSWSDQKEPSAGIDFFIAHQALGHDSLAKDMINELISEIQAKGNFIHVLADIPPGNSSAIRFLTSCGFESFGNDLLRKSL